MTDESPFRTDDVCSRPPANRSGSYRSAARIATRFGATPPTTSAPTAPSSARWGGIGDARALQLGADLAPVHHVPPGRDIVRPPVLVLQIVGVLPDIEAEDRLLAVHERVVLVRRAHDRQLAAVADQPGPP